MACNFPFLLYRQEPVPHLLPVPCGKCAACRADRIKMWTDRISFESLTSSKPSTFLTLTYNDEHLPPDKSVSLRDTQTFWKRLRYYEDERNKKVGRNDKRYGKCRFFLSSEYGESDNMRPHYHACVLNLDPYEESDFECIYKAWRDKQGNEIGFLVADGLLPARVRYCVKYISKEQPYFKTRYAAAGLKPLFHTMSKALGKDWIMAHADDIRASNGYYSDGVLRPLPMYFRDCLGMHEKNQYLADLRDIWKTYNDQLVSQGYKSIDPFNPRQAVRAGLLNRPTVDKTQTFQRDCGKLGKELHMIQREFLRLAGKV